MGRYNKDTFVAVIGTVAGLVGVGYGIAMHTKLSKISERLDASIEDLADGMEFDIPEELVEKAVDKAVAEAAKKAVDKATNEALAEVKRDIRKTVSAEVEKEYGRLHESVLKEITDSAAKIDVTKVRRDIERAAEKTALEKFNDNLDDQLQTFNDNLNNLARIYNSMAGVATRTAASDNGREFVFRVG